jgi:hypothetical protein
VSSHETLGLLLVREGAITRPQLYDALRLQRQNNHLLGSCLLQLGYVAPDKLLESLARQLAIPALPPGTLGRAAPEAVRRIPGDVAVRLRLVPYSWDGHMLGVAVADGRALNHLSEVAFHSQSAVGAYVALEAEIEAVLEKLFPGAVAQHAALSAPAEPPALDGRPRPARIGGTEVPNRDFGRALGLAEEPVVLEQPKQKAVVRAAPPRAPIKAPPPPAGPAVIRLERISFYDAVEKVYEGSTIEEIGARVGNALLNYFSCVLVLDPAGGSLTVIGFSGETQIPGEVSLDAVPAVAAGLSARTIAYGMANADTRNSELWLAFGLPPSATSLIAPIAGSPNVELLVYADNGAARDLYDDLHDVELLFKEAETALRLLQG